jgi:hypothetical protein
VVSGGLEIIRPCQGRPNERAAPSTKGANPKICKIVVHDVEGDTVRLGPCPKPR